MTDEKFMKKAIEEARIAESKGEVPVGAIVVVNNNIIARGYNQVEMLNDCTAHAEMIALTSAFSYLGSKYLFDATLYVTLEPCLMCSGALHWSKIQRIVFGASDEKNGFRQYFKNNPDEAARIFHPKTQIKAGVLEEECKQLITHFFKEKR